jgi:hypothetical protein
MTGEPEALVRGCLELLWECAYESGDPVIGDADAVEAAAKYPGEPGRLFRALLDCGGKGAAGFIETVDGDPDRFQVHDLFDHCPEYVKKRMAREHARKQTGKTLSEIRAEAGRKGGSKRKQAETNGGQLPPDAKQAEANGKQTETNGETPAPAPNTQERERESADADVPAGLLVLIDGWNALPASIVKPGNGARRDPPAGAVLKGWAGAQRNREQRDALEDTPRVLAAIRRANFCHGQDWFTLPWLFGKNRNREFNIVKLLNGGYDAHANGRSLENSSPTRPRERRFADRHWHGGASVPADAGRAASENGQT